MKGLNCISLTLLLMGCTAPPNGLSGPGGAIGAAVSIVVAANMESDAKHAKGCSSKSGAAKQECLKQAALITESINKQKKR